MRLDITGGLIREHDSDATEYGVYFYCNQRLIARGAKDAELGFMSGVAGIPHHTMSLARIFVCLNGPSKDMPWNSSKNSINYNHWIFQAIKQDIVQVVKNYGTLSRRLASDFESAVKPYASGETAIKQLSGDESIKAGRLPEIPKGRKTFKDAVFEMNHKIGEQKPWVRGLYEAIVAEDIITKQKHFDQSNRLSLIVLDSTAEIALKEFLAYETTESFSDERLSKLFLNRHYVHEEAQKHLHFNQAFWQKMTYFYKLRCDLIHKKASSGISDTDIDGYRRLVKNLLAAAFGLQFPE
jgi:hypothetical protein